MDHFLPLLLVGVLCLGMAVFSGFMARLGLRQLSLYRRMSRWPALTGWVIASDIMEQRSRSRNSGSGRLYRLNLRYRYEYCGRAYTSTRYEPLSGRAETEARQKAHPVGAAIGIRFNPDQPEAAFFIRGSPALAIVLPGGAAAIPASQLFLRAVFMAAMLH